MFLNKITNKLKAVLLMGLYISPYLIMDVTLAAEEEIKVAFPDKFMIRLSSALVDEASTNFTVLGNSGLGAGISFSNDLGGETTDTIPRLDAYYRFNNKHRLDFSTFTIARDARKTISIALDIGDETYLAGDTLVSDIEYSVYKLGYSYSFYHSPEVELSLSAGLNITSYDLKYSLESGAQADSVGVTAPLPMFGLRMGYAINPNWTVRYLSETFFVEFEDSIKGALLNYELDIEYKWFKNFSIGAGVTRLSTDVSVKDSDWKGSVKDSHRGFLLYGAFFF